MAVVLSVAFHERVKTTKVYMRDSTPVPPLAMMLLADGELRPHRAAARTARRCSRRAATEPTRSWRLDGYYRLHVPAAAAELVVRLREKVQGLVRRLIAEVDATRRAGGGRGARDAPAPAGASSTRRGTARRPRGAATAKAKPHVAEMVEALTRVSKWEDVRVVPELSAHERKKMEAQRKHAATVAEQRRLKAARHSTHQQRKGRRRPRRRAAAAAAAVAGSPLLGRGSRKLGGDAERLIAVPRRRGERRRRRRSQPQTPQEIRIERCRGVLALA